MAGETKGSERQVCPWILASLCSQNVTFAKTWTAGLLLQPLHVRFSWRSPNVYRDCCRFWKPSNTWECFSDFTSV